MVADIVDVDLATLAVLETPGNHADTGFPFGQSTEAARIRQQGLEELNRHDLLPLELDFVDACHPHVLQHLEVLQVVVGKSHPELGLANRRDMLDQRLHLLVIETVDVHRPDAFREFEDPARRKSRGLDPLPILPVAAGSCHFADIDFRIEIGRKRLAVTAGIRIDDVDLLHLVEVILCGQGGIDIGHARVEAAAKQRHQALLAETLLVIPLPFVFELGSIKRFVVGRIEIIDSGRQTGVHDREILIRQGHIDHQLRLYLLKQSREFRDIVSIDLRRINRDVLDLVGNRITFRPGP